MTPEEILAKLRAAKAAPATAGASVIDRLRAVKSNQGSAADRLANVRAKGVSPEAAARAKEADAIALEAMGAKPTPHPGITAQMGQNFAQQSGGVAAGMARGAAGLLGLPGTVSDWMDIPFKKLGILPEDAPGNILSGDSLRKSMASATGGATEYRAPGLAGGIAGTVGEFIGGGSGIGMGIAGGIGSELAGKATEGTALEPYARVAGAVAGPIAASGAAALAKRVVSPLGGVDPERLKMVKILEEFGVPVTAGQKTGSQALRKAEGATGAGQSAMAAQSDDFTRAALKTIGTDATRATPEVLAASAARIGGEFDDVLRGVDVVPDATAVTAMSEAMETYRTLAPKGTTVPLVGAINKEMVRSFRSGNPIPATTLATWRSNLSKLTTSADTATREAASAAIEAVDNATSSALVATGNPDAVARLVTARGQWRNYLAIQKAASRAGENTALGIISPSSLRNEIANQGRAAIATGRRGDIGALARAGEAVIKPLPAVTAGGVRSIPGIGPILGGMAGSAVGGPMGAAVGMVAPYVAQGAAMLAPVQRYLGNQVAGQAGPIVSRDAVKMVPGLTAGDDFDSLYGRY